MDASRCSDAPSTPETTKAEEFMHATFVAAMLHDNLENAEAPLVCCEPAAEKVSGRSHVDVDYA